MTPPIRILLIDDSPYFLQAARDFLEWQEALTVVGAVSAENEALAQAQQLRPDVILLDLNLKQQSGLSLIPKFKQQRPELRVIVLTMMTQDSYRAAALHAGADGFVAKTAMAEELIPALFESLALGGLPQAVVRPAGAPADTRFLRLAEHLPDLIYRYEFQPQRGFTYVSPSAAAITGYTPEEHYADPDLGFKLVHPQDRTLLEAAVQGNANLGQPLILRWVRKDGQILWTEQRNVGIFNEAGELVAIEGIARDITAQQQTEARVHYQAHLLESVSDAIISTDAEFNVRSWNKSAEALYGWTADEVAGRAFLDIVPTSYPDAAREAVLAQFRAAGNWQGEVIQQRKDGARLHIFAAVTMLRDSHSNPVGAVAVNRDITSQKQAQATLSLQFAALESVANAIVITDAAGIIQWVNPAFTHLTGYSRAEAVGQSPRLLKSGEQDAAFYETLWKTVLAGEVWLGQIINRRKDGRLYIEEQTITPLADNAGRVTHFIGIKQDITERVEAERALQRHTFRLSILNAMATIAVQATTETELVLRAAALIGAKLHPDKIAIEVSNHINSAPFPTAPASELVGPAVPDLPLPIEAPRRSPGDLAVVAKRPVKLSVPLVLGGQALGVINAESYRPEAFTAEDKELLHAISGILANGIERIRLLSALRQSEKKHRALIEQLPAIAYEAISAQVDGAITTTYISPQVDAILGFSPDEWLADPELWLKRIHPVDQARVITEIAARAADGRDLDIEYRVLDRDGRVRWFRNQYAATPQAADQPSRLHGLLLDITDRKQAEEALRESERFAHSTLNALATHIAVLNETGAIIFVNQAWQLFSRVNGGDANRTGVGANYLTICDEAAATGDQVAGEMAAGIRAVMRDVQAEFILEYPCHAPDVERWFVARVTRFSGAGPLRIVVGHENITARRHLAAAAARRLAEMEAVNRVAIALRAAETLEEMLPILLDETLAVLNSSAGTVLLHYPAQNVLRAVVRRGWLEAFYAAPLAPGEGFAGRVFAQGQAYTTREFAADPFVPPATRASLPAGWGGIGLPIRAGAEVVGVLLVAVKLPREITPADAQLLLSLAEMAGTALHRLRLHGETRQRVEQLQALRTIDQAITSSADIGFTLRLLLEQVTTQLGVDAAGVLRLNTGTLTLDYAAGHGFHTWMYESSSLRLDEGLAGLAAMERRRVEAELIPRPERFTRISLIVEEGFAYYAALPLVARGELKGVLEVFHRTVLQPNLEWRDFMETLAGQAAIAVEDAHMFSTLQQSSLELLQAYDTTIEGWSRAMDLRDQETEGHSRRVTDLTLALARAAGVPEEALVHLKRGALLHDIGKLGVPDAILLKPEALTEAEWAVMRRHPQLAHDLLAPIAYLRPALDIPYCHHEKWDGTGYPRGLQGEQIPLGARLFAVVDVWDALSSNRPYRAAWPREQIIAHIRALAGTHFDPQAVVLFLRLIDAHTTG